MQEHELTREDPSKLLQGAAKALYMDLDGRSSSGWLHSAKLQALNRICSWNTSEGLHS
jgi:hypothetical protein